MRTFRLANVHLLFGDGMAGFARGAPYAGIIAAAGGEAVPAQWTDQLAEGGRIVAPMVMAEFAVGLTDYRSGVQIAMLPYVLVRLLVIVPAPSSRTFAPLAARARAAAAPIPEAPPVTTALAPVMSMRRRIATQLERVSGTSVARERRFARQRRREPPKWAVLTRLRLENAPPLPT